jgi:hypothetical protein
MFCRLLQQSQPALLQNSLLRLTRKSILLWRVKSREERPSRFVCEKNTKADILVGLSRQPEALSLLVLNKRNREQNN